jgi:hypothetical protein
MPWLPLPMGPISQASECDKEVKILNKISSIKIKYVLTDTDNGNEAVLEHEEVESEHNEGGKECNLEIYPFLLSRRTRAHGRFFVQYTPHWISCQLGSRGTRAHGRFLVQLTPHWVSFQLIERSIQVIY